MIFPLSRLDRFFRNVEISNGIVSIWGEFGVGKTTFALQTALKSMKNNQLILYFYTKPIFPSEKVLNILGKSEEKLRNIQFIELIDFDEMYTIVFNLEFLILKTLNTPKNPYKMIIIDSLTDLYRLKVDREKKERNYNLNYRLNQILANLFYLNTTYGVDILIINEKVQKRENDETIEVQSGGNVMEYWVSFDIKIERSEIDNKRKLTLTTKDSDQSININSTLTKNGFQ